MPSISMFYGIIIYMYYEKYERHHLPHIHAVYQEYELVLALDGEILAGDMPPAKLKLLEAWLEIHREELEANWKLLLEGGAVYKIEPLR